MRPSTSRLSVVIAVIALISLIPFVVHADNVIMKSANMVWGQTTFTGNTSGTSATTVKWPDATVFDVAGNMYVADRLNHRVVRYPVINGVIAKTADQVWGQPDFTSSSSSTTSTGLYEPSDLTFDVAGNMYVADQLNNRVVRYPVTNGVIAKTADQVWGQPGFTTRTSGTGATNLNDPHKLAFDAAGNLHVVERNNNRVVRYPVTNGVIAKTADRVWGQTDFGTDGSGISATTLFSPSDLSFDTVGNLYVGDNFNNRVVRYPVTNGVIAKTADQVWGQPNLTSNESGTSATTMSRPEGISFDVHGNLHVADSSNDRILRFPVANGVVSTTADQVWGQPDFTTGTSGTSSTKLYVPKHVIFDAAGNMYVTDTINQRVLRFSVAVSPAITTNPAAQTIPYDTTATLSVVATGDPAPTYQWYEGQSGDTSKPVTGGTSASLQTGTLTATTSFWVRITNEAGSVDSDAVLVTVSPIGVSYHPSTDTFSLTNYGYDEIKIAFTNGEFDGGNSEIPGRFQGFLPRGKGFLTVHAEDGLEVTVNAGTAAIVAPTCANLTATVWPGTAMTIRNLDTNMWMLPGTDEADVIVGSSGSDMIDAEAGNDTICGGKGNDQIGGGGDNDRIYGGPGNDNLEGGQGNDTLTGQDGDDTLDGGADNDTLYADGADTTLLGGTGTDTVSGLYSSTGLTADLGGGGIERAYGSDSADTFTSSTLPDGAEGVLVYGRGGNDTITGSPGVDTLYGDAGEDTINGADGNDTINGGKDDDMLDGGADDDTLYIDADDTMLMGGSGTDTVSGLYSSTSIDVDLGPIGFERAYGTNYADTFTSDSVPDGALGITVYGRGGNDTITGSSGPDTLYGEGGNDTIRGEGGNDIINGGKDDDTLEGGAGNDRIMGESGADTLKGDADDDTLYPDTADTLVQGGTGIDTVNGSYSSTGLTLNLGPNGIEIAYGSASVDTFTSATKPDSQDFVIVYGRGGNDTIYGSPGNDRLYGEGGDDHLYGEAGDDVFDGGKGKDFFSGGEGTDRINAFDAADDTKDSTFP